MSLELIGRLDRESIASYQLEVIATDGSPNDVIRNSATLSVTVVVKDENDNVPLFSFSDYYEQFALPVQVGTELIQVEATDSDIGDNGRITYHIENSDMFYIDAENGRIQLTNEVSTSSGNFTVVIVVSAR